MPTVHPRVAPAVVQVVEQPQTLHNTATKQLAPGTAGGGPARGDHLVPSMQDLVKQVLSALRAIAGNDDVKDAIIRAGGTESIVATMTRHLASPQVPPVSV